MEILKAHDKTGWITCISNRRWVQAKVYDDPSTFGINNGRISKMSISRTGGRDGTKNFHDQMAYGYDRGLYHHDPHNLPDELLNKIITDLESLPKVWPQDNVEQFHND